MDSIPIPRGGAGQHLRQVGCIRSGNLHIVGVPSVAVSAHRDDGRHCCDADIGPSEGEIPQCHPIDVGKIQTDTEIGEIDRRPVAIDHQIRCSCQLPMHILRLVSRRQSAIRKQGKIEVIGIFGEVDDLCVPWRVGRNVKRAVQVFIYGFIRPDSRNIVIPVRHGCFCRSGWQIGRDNHRAPHHR
jgi:hypothetical protein